MAHHDPDSETLPLLANVDANNSTLSASGGGENGYKGLDDEQQQHTTLQQYKDAHPRFYYTPPPQRTAAQWLTSPWDKSAAYFRRVRGNFSLPFLLLLVSAYMGVKGSLATFLNVGLLPYFKNYLNVSGQKYQAYGTVANTPWSLKGFIGVLSDCMPLFGYHKRYYIVLAALLSTVSFLLISTIHIDSSEAYLAASLFFFCYLGVVVVDLLCEAQYAEVMNLRPWTGSDIITWVWGAHTLGSIFASAAAGPMADHDLVKEMFWICAPLSAQVLLPVLLGGLPEKRVTQAACTFDTQKFRDNRVSFLLALFLGACSLGLAVANLFASNLVILIASLSLSLLLCCAVFYALPPVLAKCNVYLFLSQALYLQIQGAVDYFYTADSECLEDGPHFSYVFYVTWSTVAQNVFSFLGVLLFQNLMSEWQFRTAFWVTCVLRALAGIFDVIIAKRWNEALGIPDHFMYMLGYNMVYQVCSMIDFIPAVILTGKLCPPGMQSTVYAMLAGFQSFGQGIARSIGLYMIELLDVQTTVPCNFSNLPLLITLCHIALPLLTVPLTFWLIPKAGLSDKIIDDGSSPLAGAAGAQNGSGSGSNAAVNGGASPSGDGSAGGRADAETYIHPKKADDPYRPQAQQLRSEPSPPQQRTVRAHSILDESTDSVVLLADTNPSQEHFSLVHRRGNNSAAGAGASSSQGAAAASKASLRPLESSTDV
eukprot:m.184662 g.184662  ORF g.184662 m.184662 type:complete len:708 (-) comp17489_c0_seq6:1685-3808(-)